MTNVGGRPDTNLATDGSTGANAAPGPAGFTLDYSTYLGGFAWERIQSVFVDATSAIYMGGTTKSDNFPTRTGAFNQSLNGEMDVFIAKTQADGDAVWAYLASDPVVHDQSL